MLKVQKNKNKNPETKKNRNTNNVKEHRKYIHANKIHTYIHRFVDGMKFWQVFFSLFISKPRFGFLSISY